ncbi:hypothetical protein ABFS82_02G162400 [Erythranthe guttata]
MYAQTLPFSKHIIHNPPTKRQIPAFPPNSQLGFSNSAKRVSVSGISSRKSAHLAMIVCGGSQDKQEVVDDGYYMRRCVELAKKAIGCTSPNPMVGCVIVNDGKIVGQGFHPKAGQPHAEVFALRDAGDLAENGTAYVSLEPCNHYGRTPPCTEALIKAKVKNVVIGMVDPNPIVASTGVKKLQESGIKVTIGVEEDMCKRLNEAYIHYMLSRTPYLTLRYSITLDGYLLNELSEEAMECGGYYSKLLQEYDAIVLSSTGLVDKSSFPISNEPGANQPLKIVLKKDSASKLSIISEGDIVQEGTSLSEILEHCKNRGMCSVLVDLRGDDVDFEGVIREGLELNLFQKVVVEVLPFFGGGGERRVLKGMDVKAKVKKMTSFASGKSVILEGYF